MTTLLYGLCSLTSVALADVPVTPMNGRGEVLIMGDPGVEQAWYALDPGDKLDFGTPGPVKLVVFARQRLTGDEQASKASIDALGDGARIMSIRVSQGPMAGGMIFDAKGGVPTEIDMARFTVPAGGNVFSLQAPSGAADFLVRVEKVEDKPEPPPVAEVDPWDPNSFLNTLNSDEGDPFEPGVDTTAVTPTEPVAAATGPEPKPEKEPREEITLRGLFEAPPRSGAVVGNQSQIGFAGPEFGLGAPMRGDKTVLYVGARYRRPILVDQLDVTGAAGWYRIGVEQELPVDIANQGAEPMNLGWNTHVMPITVDAVYHIPLTDMGFDPIVGAGAGMYLGFRRESDEKAFGPSMGFQAFTGGDVAVGPGSVTTTVSFNGAWRKFGSVDIAGDEVHEVLSTFRVNTSYLIPF